MATSDATDDLPPPPPAPASSLPRVTPDLIEQEEPEAIDNIVPSRGYDLPPLVALGGSAGSIPSLQEFFREMPEESGFSFVIILHFSPEHASTLVSIIQACTPMAVNWAKDGAQLEPNCVYVIPPGKLLQTGHGTLRVADAPPERSKRVEVDLFFRSLADTHGAHGAGIVFSGADGDGALGIKRLKERGGLTVAQDPSEAEHPSMPRTAMETGMVDWVLRAREMPSRLCTYFEHEERLQLPPEEGPQPAEPEAPPRGEEEAAFREVLTFLRARTGRDFSYYKRATILRRVARRMQVNGVEDVPAYLAYIRTHPGEAAALLQDLLISVTNFFRDRDAFLALERQIPAIFAGKRSDDTVRVWSAACATGEEAYSIAILFLEHARGMEAPPAIQVFACDLDEQAIQVARSGFYPSTIAADVSEERLRRFFTKEHRGYRVRRELREAVLFASHDLLKDAPFSRMDLISCRNLLIYLTHEAQQRALELFHFALQHHGRLFLGASEMVDDDSALFMPLDKKHRIYQQRAARRAPLPMPMGPNTRLQTLITQEQGRNVPVTIGASFIRPPVPQAADYLPLGRERVSLPELHFRLMDPLAPASVLVNQNADIVHLSERAGKFLQFGGGEPTTNLLRVVHPSLRVELRAALFRAVEQTAPVETPGIETIVDGEPATVDLHVYPARELAPGFQLVVLELRKAAESPRGEPRRPDAEPLVRQLERQLESVNTSLRDKVEQYEAGMEELKASNEELQAMNEELRSATEELETSREELQSINEELSTVNHELKLKVDELGSANSDLHNLMASTAIATVFLNRELRVMRYTPPAVALFNLIPSDLGRPLADLKQQINYPDLSLDAERVLDELVPREREVGDTSGRWFMARMLPYRTVDDRIGGLVITFFDITERKRVEQELMQSQERLRLVIENAREYAIFTLDLGRRVTSWNIGAQRTVGWSEQEMIGQSGDIVFTPEDRAAGVPAQEVGTALSEGRSVDERWHMRKDGSRFWGSGVMTAMRDQAGKVVGLLKIFRDQTQAREAQQALEQGRQELWEALQENERARAEVEAAAAAKDHFLAVLSHELRTPLTPVLMTVHALRRRKDLAPDVLAALEMIRRNVTLEARFIDDLLEITRVARGKLEITREPVDLHEVASQAVEISRPDIEGKQQQLTVDFAATETLVNGDSARLQQLIWNLLKNASKFTPEGGAIAARTRNTPGKILLEVTDTGIGIEPDVMALIFDPFAQGGENVTRQYGGLGLGLAIAKAAADAHGGSLRAESAGTGRGAIFTLELPLLA